MEKRPFCFEIVFPPCCEKNESGETICEVESERLYQDDDGTYYKELVVDEITMETEVNHERGTIYDNSGNVRHSRPIKQNDL